MSRKFQVLLLLDCTHLSFGKLSTKTATEMRQNSPLLPLWSDAVHNVHQKRIISSFEKELSLLPLL